MLSNKLYFQLLACFHVCMLSHFSHVRFFATPWTVAYQGPWSMGFSRQEYWSGLPCPSLGDLPDPGIEPGSLHCRQILYHLNHQGSLYWKADVCLSFIRCMFWKYFLLTVAHLFILFCVYHRAEFKISTRPNSSIFSFTDLTFRLVLYLKSHHQCQSSLSWRQFSFKRQKYRMVFSLFLWVLFRFI